MATQRQLRHAIAGALMTPFFLVAVSTAGCVAAERSPDVRYEPSPPAVVQAMLELAEAGPEDILYDLGSGDGRIVIAAARDFGVRRAIGVDIDSKRIREARENAREAGVPSQVRFIQADLFTFDFSDADVATLYLLPRLNIKLRPRLLEELTPGTRIVSHSHDMDDWTPDKHIRVRGRDLYLWIIPARAEGRWTWQSGDQAYGLSLNQTFQKVSGTLSTGNRTTPLMSATLNGDRLNFTVMMPGDGDDPARFSGRITDNEIQGELNRGTETVPVTAKRVRE